VRLIEKENEDLGEGGGARSGRGGGRAGRGGRGGGAAGEAGGRKRKGAATPQAGSEDGSPQPERKRGRGG
jgi:hypothetical protein